MKEGLIMTHDTKGSEAILGKCSFGSPFVRFSYSSSVYKQPVQNILSHCMRTYVRCMGLQRMPDAQVLKF